MFKLKKFTKEKVVKQTKGVISIMLCIIAVPVMTISSALVEIFRYQQTAATTQEVIDSATLSSLADYDEYLDQRFGLMALSQEGKSIADYTSIIGDNSNVLGKAVTINSITGKPVLPFTFKNSQGVYNVLQKQIVDYSESTVMADFLMSDLNLENLLTDLFSLGGLGDIADIASDMCDLVDGLEDFTTSVDTLVTNITSVKTQINTLVSKTQGLTDSIYAFYEKLANEDFDIQSASVEQVESMVNTYKSDILAIYQVIIDIKDGVNNLSTTVTNLPSDFEDAKNKYEDLADTIDSIVNGLDSADGDINDNVEASSKDTAVTFQSVLTSVEDAMDEAANTFKDDFVNNLKESAELFVEQFKSKFKFDKYNEEYFSVPLSDNAKADLKTILQALPSFVKDGDATEFKNTLKTLFLPDCIDFTNLQSIFTSLEDTLSSMVEEVKNSFLNSMEDSISAILTKLINTIKELFNLDGLYNDDLNAVVKSLAESDNPYQNLFDALNKIFEAVEEFKAVDKAESFGEKLKAIFTSTLKAVKKLYEGAKLAIESMVNTIKNLTDNIKRFCGYITGQKGSLYECLLLAAYMTKVLPSRINAGSDAIEVTLQNGISLSQKTLLEGKSITGYDYSQIPVANTEMVNSNKGLWDMMKEGILGTESECFKGAELEYILGGTSSEYTNQLIAFMNIYIIRLLCDIPTVLKDTNVSSMASAASIACWVVYILVIIGEPLCDTILLVNDIPVDLFKDKCFLTPLGIPSLVAAVGSKAPGIEGILGELSGGSTGGGNYSASDGAPEYPTYIILSLMLSVGEDKMVSRFKNIVEMEAKQYYKHSGASFTFDMKKTYTAIHTETNLTFNSFLNVFSSEFFEKTIIRERGY